MTLFHVTSKANQASIDAVGLDPERATHQEKAVWLVGRRTSCGAGPHRRQAGSRPDRGPDRLPRRDRPLEAPALSPRDLADI